MPLPPFFTLSEDSLLRDPDCATWLAERFSSLATQAPDQAKEAAEALVSPENLPVWLSHPAHECLANLLEAAPPELLRTQEEALLAHWEQASPSCRLSLLPTLSKALPEVASEPVSRFVLGLREDPSYPGTLLDMALAACPPEWVRDLVPRLDGWTPRSGAALQSLRRSGLPAWQELLLPLLLGPGAPEPQRSEEGDAGDDLLTSWMEELHPELAFLDFLQWASTGLSEASCQDLAPLFPGDLPLGTLDAILADSRWEDVPELVPLPRESPPESLASLLSRALAGANGEIGADLGLLLLAHFLQESLLSGDEIRSLAPETARDLLLLDLPHLPGREALLQVLRDLGEGEPEGLHSLLSEVLDGIPSLDRAGQLAWAVARLVARSPWDEGLRWLSDLALVPWEEPEELSRVLVQAGPALVPHLLERLPSIHEEDRTDLLLVLEVYGGSELEEYLVTHWDRLSRLPAMDLSILCLAVPTERVRDRLAGESDRGLTELVEALRVLCKLTGSPTDSLPPPPDRIELLTSGRTSLELTCGACGISAAYPQPPIFFPARRENPEIFLGGETECLRCGSCNHFRLSPETRFAIEDTVLQAANLSEGASVLASQGIYVLEPPRGHRSFSQALEAAEEATRTRSGSPGAWLQLGRLQASMLRPTPAQEALREGLSLAPGQPELTLELASLLAEAGRSEEALELLESSRRTQATWCFLEVRGEGRTEVVYRLQGLHERLSGELGRLGLDPWQESALPTSGPGSQPRRERVGRNSPCPCGSGRKYKKCCLN